MTLVKIIGQILYKESKMVVNFSVCIPAFLKAGILDSKTGHSYAMNNVHDQVLIDQVPTICYCSLGAT